MVSFKTEKTCWSTDYSLLPATWRWNSLYPSCTGNITNGMWFTVVRTLIDNDMRHHSSQILLWTHTSAPCESTTFWPLWWRVLLLITVWTTLNHIRFEKMFFQSASWIKHSLTHWPEQRCLDFYRQRQISQSDCKITGDCGKKLLIELISYIMFNSLFAYVETSNWMCHLCGQQNRKSFLSTILYYGDIK